MVPDGVSTGYPTSRTAIPSLQTKRAIGKAKESDPGGRADPSPMSHLC